MRSIEMQRLIDLIEAGAASLGADFDYLDHRRLSAVASDQGSSDPALQVENVSAYGVHAELVWHENSDADRIVLYAHGGGYVSGSPASCRRLAGTLSRASKSRFLLLDYRLAPEHPFPAAIEDGRNAYRWILDQGYDANHVAFGGDSSGGGLAIALLLATRDGDLALPAAAFAISPWADMTLSSRSMTAVDSPDPIALSNRDYLSKLATHYMSGTDPRHPLASPLFGDLRGLPPLHLEAGTDDRLVDDTRNVAEKARAAGMTVSMNVTPGAIHNFPNVAPHSPEAEAAIDRIAAHLNRWLP